MPLSPPHACPHPGCPALVPYGTSHCPVHTKAEGKADRARRGSAAERGYDARWRAYRLEFLAANPLCVLCLLEKLVTPATVVDHIVDHKGDEALFWDPKNHQAVCKPCHDKRVDAGDFGRKA